MTSNVVTGVDPKEMLPTIFRFKAMELLTKIESTYHDHWDQLKQELADFIKEWESKGLTDAHSEGLLRNL